MKYIDSNKLITEIEKLYEIARNASYNGEVEGEMTAYDKILSFITSLQQEQPEVELGREIDNWLDAEPHTVRDTAIHFYELGLNARK